MAEPTASQSGDFTPPAGSNGVSDLINNSSNTGKEVGQTIASVTLTQGLKTVGTVAGKGVLGKAAGPAGALVQPAIWVVSGKAPQPGDIELWGVSTIVSLFGAITLPATLITGFAKAGVEDAEDGQIALAASKEPEQYRPFIRSTRYYTAAGRYQAAQAIAVHGGVAWRVTTDGVWCYITDAQGRLVCDFQPSHAYEVMGPDLPLRILKYDYDGAPLFQWGARKGNLI